MVASTGMMIVWPYSLAPKQADKEPRRKTTKDDFLSISVAQL